MTVVGRSDRGLWWEEVGPASAPLVVLVHGSMDRSSGMARVARRLHDQYRVLRADRRGYGRSRPHAGPYGMDEQVADLVELLDGRSAVLVGHSYGGNVVLATAERHPDLTRAVAVYEPPLSWEPWWPGTTAGAVAVASSPEDAAEAFLRRMLGDRRWEALPDRVRLDRRAEGPALVGELTDLREHAPWHGDAIGARVVAGYGERARPHHRDGVRELVTRIPGAVAVEVPEAHHDAHRAHADRFVDLVLAPVLPVPPRPPVHP